MLGTLLCTISPLTLLVSVSAALSCALHSVYFSGLLAIALIAIASTAMAQIFTNTYQKSLSCDALQLLYHTSPYIALVIRSPSFSGKFLIRLIGNAYLMPNV